MEKAVDLGIVFLIVLMTYVVSSEGLWGAALMFFNVLFSGIIAFNFYEPLAGLIAANANFLSGFADTISMLGLFIVSLVMLRLTTETIAPSMVRFPMPVYHVGRIAFSLATSLVLMAMVILAFEAAPVHKKIFGVIDYKHEPPFGMGLDREWLGFFQYTTGAVFADYNSGGRDWMGEYGTAKAFDPQARWLLEHQDARPYGTETVLSEFAASAEGGAAAPPAGAAPAPGPGRGGPRGEP
jgi:hypothetical protein